MDNEKTTTVQASTSVTQNGQATAAQQDNGSTKDVKKTVSQANNRDIKRIAKRVTKREKADNSVRYDPFRSALRFDPVACNYFISPQSAADQTQPFRVVWPKLGSAIVPAQSSGPSATAAAVGDGVASPSQPGVRDALSPPPPPPSSPQNEPKSPADKQSQPSDKPDMCRILDLVCEARIATSDLTPVICLRCDAEARGEPGYEMLHRGAFKYRSHWRTISNGEVPICEGCSSQLVVRQQNIEGVPVFACHSCQNESYLVGTATPNPHSNTKYLKHYKAHDLAPLAEMPEPTDMPIFSAHANYWYTVLIPSLMPKCPMCTTDSPPAFVGMTSARQAKRVIMHYSKAAAVLRYHE